MNATQGPRLVFSAESHVGAVRGHNEDAFSVRADLGLAIVADGMGGAAAGEVASELAVTAIEGRIAAGEGPVGATLAAHEAIVAAPAEGRGKAGMGSTVVVLRCDDGDYEIAWVGDSRAYLLREGELRQLTRDHSLVQELVDRGEITPAEARRHPQRNIITQVLGGMGIVSPRPERVSGVVEKGDVFLLCSDGLNGELDDDAIRSALNAAENPQQAAETLVHRALAAGGHDNITAVIVAVGK